jgi:DnaK suppressor protein
MLAAFLKMMGMPSGKPLQSRAKSPIGVSEKRGITLHESTDVATGRRQEKASASAARRQEVKTPAKKSAMANKAKKPAAKPASKPAGKLASKAKPATKSTAKPAAKKPVAKPVTKKPTAKPVAKKAAAKPAAKASKPTAKPAAKPVTKPQAKPAPKAAGKPVVKAAPKSSAKPSVKPQTQAKAPVKPVAKAAPKVAVKATVKAPAPVKPVAPPMAAPAVAAKAASAPAAPSKSGKAGSRIVPSYTPTAAQAPIGGHGAAKASFTMSAPVLAPPPQVVIKKDPKLANNWKTKGPEQLLDAEVIAMPDSEYMNDKQLAFFRLKLVALKDGILSNAGETTEHLREDTSIVPDPADRATIEEEHALELRTRDRERKLLKKIEQAIARIDAEEYGYCDETGEPIGVARLIARPTATLSLEAQQRRELKQKMFGD